MHRRDPTLRNSECLWAWSSKRVEQDRFEHHIVPLGRLSETVPTAPVALGDVFEGVATISMIELRLVGEIAVRQLQKSYLLT